MTGTLRLDFCSHEAAAFAVRAWHYSRSLPTPPLVKIGVWESGAFIGCVLFSRGANRHMGGPFGLDATQICELSRIALRAHAAPVSRIVRIALALLRRRCPGLRMVVSFADPAQGHVGTIYQGMGWLYLARTQPSRVFVDARGRKWHPRMVSSTGIKPVYGKRRPVARIADCRIETTPGKHRYVLPLDDELRAQLLPLAQSYPKREPSRDNAAAPPRAEGGVIPTGSLQLGDETAHV